MFDEDIEEIGATWEEPRVWYDLSSNEQLAIIGVGGALAAVGAVVAALILVPPPTMQQPPPPTPTPTPSPSPAPQETASAVVVEPNGSQTTSATLNVGDEMKIATTVPSNTQPTTIQAVISPNPSGQPSSVHPWDISATGYTYVEDFGGAPDLPGVYTVYEVVTFADGNKVQSNPVTIDIQSGGGTSSGGQTCHYPVTTSSPNSCILQAFKDSGYYALLTPSEQQEAASNPSSWLASHTYLYSASDGGYPSYFAAS